MSGATTEFAGRGATHEKGSGPGGRSQGKTQMLNVLEKPAPGKLEPSEYVGFSEDHRAAMWLDEEVKKAKKGVTTQVIELTPGLARVLLDRNPGNRRLRENDVENYARNIANGQWAFNGEAIIVAADGTLNDGQHRCSAVVQADRAITVPLIIGVERTTRTTLDQGRTRAIADYLAMEGFLYTAQLGAAAHMIWRHKTWGHIGGGGKQCATKAELLDLVSENPSICDSVVKAHRPAAAAHGGASLIAFCHWVFWQAAGKDAPDEFVEKLLGGVGLLSRNPILYIRNRLVAERGRLRPNDKAELIFRAWNAWRKGEAPRTLTVQGGILPVLEK